jgi:hypothetical protein
MNREKQCEPRKVREAYVEFGQPPTPPGALFLSLRRSCKTVRTGQKAQQTIGMYDPLALL